VIAQPNSHFSVLSISFITSEPSFRFGELLCVPQPMLALESQPNKDFPRAQDGDGDDLEQPFQVGSRLLEEGYQFLDEEEDHR
jgi:hypothetical protein